LRLKLSDTKSKLLESEARNSELERSSRQTSRVIGSLCAKSKEFRDSSTRVIYETYDNADLTITEPIGSSIDDLENLIGDSNSIFEFFVGLVEKYKRQDERIERERKEIDALSSSQSEKEQRLQELYLTKSHEYATILVISI
jgi:hypothetical protein